jgi:hypothetical protein
MRETEAEGTTRRRKNGRGVGSFVSPQPITIIR